MVSASRNRLSQQLLLHRKNAYVAAAERPAAVATHHIESTQASASGRRHCHTQALRSRMGNRHPKLATATGKICRDGAGPYSEMTSLELRSRFFLGWICPAFANPCLGLDPISGSTKAAFDRQQSRPTSSQQHSEFRVHFTRRDRRSCAHDE